MPSNFKISDAAKLDGRNAYSNAVASQLAGGTLEIRTGSPPTNTTDADSGTLLATLTLPDPAFATASGGSATALAISSTTGLAAGTAGHYRAKASGGTVILQGTAGNAADTPDLVLNNKVVAVGNTVGITSLSFGVG